MLCGFSFALMSAGKSCLVSLLSPSGLFFLTLIDLRNHYSFSAKTLHYEIFDMNWLLFILTSSAFLEIIMQPCIQTPERENVNDGLELSM